MQVVPDEAQSEARRKLRGVCRVCRECDGRACAGEVPGMGGLGSGRAFTNNYDALARMRLNMRTIHGAAKPDTAYHSFLGVMEMPVLGAPLGGVALNIGGAMEEDEFDGAIVEGALAAGTIAFVGDGPDPLLFQAALRAVAKVGGRAISIIKPRDNDTIRSMLGKIEDSGAVAAGIDVDAAGFVNMTRHGQPVEPKTPRQLREIVEMTSLPLILKGIMTLEDAEAAAEAGIAAIVVSNHGGRALDDTPGAADVLPGIAERVQGKIAIWADGAARSGSDVLKYLALGAEAVLVGRPLAIAAIGGGPEAVRDTLRGYQTGLASSMLLTGCSTLQEISHHVIYS
ncbi:MAG: alpha-hydroxy-acid oxidizing protein [Chloroflexi bacterium]|nr:alpha-hydroxy-acid oxidizing protein [Chloroflexota bacterium]